MSDNGILNWIAELFGFGGEQPTAPPAVRTYNPPPPRVEQMPLEGMPTQTELPDYNTLERLPNPQDVGPGYIYRDTPGFSSVPTSQEMREMDKSSMFDKAIGQVFNVEGGYSVDRGGPTMRGVAWKYNKDKLGQMGYTEDTMRNLTPEDARVIYTDYWDRAQAGALPESVALPYFETFVNNESRGRRMLQQTLKDLGYDVAVDGVVGPKTLEAAQKAGKDKDFERIFRLNTAKDYIKNGDWDPKEVNGVLNRYLGDYKFDTKSNKLDVSNLKKAEIIKVLDTLTG